MTPAMLGAVLDSQMVVLDVHRARVLLLDARTERIWRACAGQTGDEIAAAVGDAPGGVMSTLAELAEVGLVTSDQGRWVRAQIEWV